MERDGREYVTLGVSWKGADVSYAELPVLGASPRPHLSSLAQRQRVTQTAGQPADLLSLECFDEHRSSSPPAAAAVDVGGGERRSESFSHTQTSQRRAAPRPDLSSRSRRDVEVPAAADIRHPLTDQRPLEALDSPRRVAEGQVEVSIHGKL
eukprot:766615-Hanusia_phi.AAC.4